jgi:tetratricopeptide (TPR) repeat protein
VLIALTIVVVYWPILNADFVWDDKIAFHDNAWFRGNAEWRQILSNGFAEWKNYFRPLGLALFLCEAHLFGTNAAPFHAVSLLLHVANAFVLSLLAKEWFSAKNEKPLWVPAFAMLFYGLHPTLIEPVSWIAAQCDLLATFFVFAGLLVNLRVNRVGLRSVLLGLFCLFGLLAKESAAAFPILVVLSDFYVHASGTQSLAGRTRRTIADNAATYAFLAAAVLAYLIFRHAALGGAGFSISATPPMRYLQTVAFLYVQFWQLVISPVMALSPTHTKLSLDLGHVSAATMTYCTLAIAMMTVGIFCAVRRWSSGILVLGVTASLFPVLHLIPVNFDESLYHERYAIIAIAFFAAFVPAVLRSAIAQAKGLTVRFALATFSAAWLSCSIVTARAVEPMWKDDVALWRWAWRNEPGSVVVMDRLMAAYIDAGRLPEARRVADVMVNQGTTCITCLLNVAFLAIQAGDAQQASQALDRAGIYLTRSQPSQLEMFEYILSIGNLRQLQNEPAAAEAAYRDAIAADPLSPDGHACLASLLALDGRFNEARAEFEQVRRLAAPDALGKQIAIFEQAMDEGRRKGRNPPH